jgi:hypothetical protein
MDADKVSTKQRWLWGSHSSFCWDTLCEMKMAAEQRQQRKAQGIVLPVCFQELGSPWEVHNVVLFCKGKCITWGLS